MKKINIIIAVLIFGIIAFTPNYFYNDHTLFSDTLIIIIIIINAILISILKSKKIKLCLLLNTILSFIYSLTTVSTEEELEYSFLRINCIFPNTIKSIKIESEFALSFFFFIVIFESFIISIFVIKIIKLFFKNSKY